MSLEAELERLAVAELERANKKFPLFASDHEGYAVILEEFQESEEEVNRARFRLNRLWESVRAEAIQTAAMCEKFIQSQEERKYGQNHETHQER